MGAFVLALVMGLGPVPGKSPGTRATVNTIQVLSDSEAAGAKRPAVRIIGKTPRVTPAKTKVRRHNVTLAVAGRGVLHELMHWYGRPGRRSLVVAAKPGAVQLHDVRVVSMKIPELAVTSVGPGLEVVIRLEYGRVTRVSAAARRRPSADRAATRGYAVELDGARVRGVTAVDGLEVDRGHPSRKSTPARVHLTVSDDTVGSWRRRFAPGPKTKPAKLGIVLLPTDPNPVKVEFDTKYVAVRRNAAGKWEVELMAWARKPTAPSRN